MNDDPGKDAAGEAREAREHEREAQQRDSHEESPAGEDEAGESPASGGARGPDEDPDEPAPPGVGRGNLTG